MKKLLFIFLLLIPFLCTAQLTKVDTFALNQFYIESEWQGDRLSWEPVVILVSIFTINEIVMQSIGDYNKTEAEIELITNITWKVAAIGVAGIVTVICIEHYKNKRQRKILYKHKYQMLN